MKYVTYAIEIDPSSIDTSDPFSLVLPSARGEIISPRTRRHSNRLDALLRVKAHNSNPRSIDGALLWTLAVEIDLDTTPEIEAVWLQGEQGFLEASYQAGFRFMSPTLEEIDLLSTIQGNATPDAWPEIELAVTRLEWELDPSLVIVRERLAEALACYHSELWRSSIVMLGCVAESITRDLIAAFERVLVADDGPAYRRKMKATFSAGQRFQVFERFCRPDLYGMSDSQTLQETREAHRSIQRLRNQCSHPSDWKITQSDAAGCFGELAEFCRLANWLSDHFCRLQLGRTTW